MERILDVDNQPPYVEVFSHHPLMYMSLCNHRLACTQSTPKELLHWCHGVHCKIDDISSSLGLYKIKMLGQQGPSCMFTISPDMPPKQQADVMFAAAKQLKAMLAEVLLPGGDRLAVQITVHAGKYAGGVVGKGSWTYDLFGSDVQDLLDMDRFNSPNSIQVSDPALALFSDAQEFERTCKLVCSGHEVVLHRWIGQADFDGNAAAAAAAAATAAALKAPPAHLQQSGMPPTVKPQAAQQQQPFAGSIVQQREACSPAADGCCMQPDLLFTDHSLEDAYVGAQAHQLARMDMLFVAVSMCMMLGLAWSASYSPELLLLSCGQWLVPLVAAGWYLMQPRSYSSRREQLWVLHRVLSALNLAVVIGYCVLSQQQRLRGAAAAGMAAQSVLGTSKCIAGMLRRQAVVMLGDSLGLKVRLRAHLLSLAFSVAATIMGVLWQWTSSGEHQSSAQALWDLLLRLLVGCVAPTVLLYWWEFEDRSLFLAGRKQGSDKFAAAGKYGRLGGLLPAKSKVV